MNSDHLPSCPTARAPRRGALCPQTLPHTREDGGGVGHAAGHPDGGHRRETCGVTRDLWSECSVVLEQDVR